MTGRWDGADPLSGAPPVVKATALALQDVPEANSAWLGEVIRQCVLNLWPSPPATPLHRR